MRAPPDTFRFRYFHKQWKKELINFTFDKLFHRQPLWNWQAINKQHNRENTPHQSEALFQKLSGNAYFFPLPPNCCFPLPCRPLSWKWTVSFPSFLLFKNLRWRLKFTNARLTKKTRHLRLLSYLLVKQNKAEEGPGHWPLQREKRN